MMKNGARIVQALPKGNGAKLTIEYQLPKVRDNQPGC
jgi:hypothetical protein